MAKFIRQPIVRRAVLGGVAAAAVLASSVAGWAENTKVRFAYLVADSMLPALYAQDKGYFAAEGIDAEFTPVQGGPAAVAAIASGEADVGYAALVPPINGRLNGVPLKIFLQLGKEAEPDKKFTWLVASAVSGITDLAGIKGKKIGFNANGGLCELAWRDHLASVGLTIDDVQPVVLPFPEQEAALEQGNIDATCAINPFYSSMQTNAALGAVTLASGTLTDLSTPLANDGLFATEDWLATNSAAPAAIARVMAKARAELLGDRAEMETAVMKYMELTPEAAKAFTLPVVDESMTITAADVQRLLDAMIKTGMQTGPLDGADFVVETTY
jgi:NitT/TauT family transport system substrate-binding protein